MDWGIFVTPLAAASYELTLFAAVGLLIGGIDDLVLDLIYLRHRVKRAWRGERTPVLAEMRPAGRRLAVFIAAWDESAVIGQMLSMLSARWSSDRLTVFVGVYPNDPATIAAVAAVAEGDARLRMIVGNRAGPTTKADCLNGVWRAMREEEALSGEPFAAIVLHDAEDMVHPGEPAVFDHYLATAGAVQLPVVPLPRPGAHMVGGTYLDEFAESHGKSLVVRSAIGAGLPLAGVGCAICRALLGEIAETRGGSPFDAGSLTEDYELGLTIAAMGAPMVLATVSEHRGGPPVAVRAYFPGTLDTAVRQKTRWLLGIALAGWDRTGWGRAAHVGEWWMRMRDRRAPIAMVVLGSAYLSLLLWLVQLMLGLAGARWPTLPPQLATLLGLNAVLFVWRAGMRALFVHRLYGAGEAWRSVPRMFVGNIVAMMASRRALLRYARMLRGAPVHWDKTAHQFPDAAAARPE